jgi:hypothetical protein
MKAAIISTTDAVLRILLGPDDFLGRHPGLCLAGVALLLIATEVLTNA